MGDEHEQYSQDLFLVNPIRRNFFEGVTFVHNTNSEFPAQLLEVIEACSGIFVSVDNDDEIYQFEKVSFIRVNSGRYYFRWIQEKSYAA